MSTRGKFLPEPTIETEPYWQGCRNRQLLIQHCTACGEWQFFPRLMCVACDEEHLEWKPVSGRGTVETFTVVHVPLTDAYAVDVPYVVALIRLEEGPLMMTNLVTCEPADVWIGMPVEVTYEQWSESVVMPQFRPAG